MPRVGVKSSRAHCAVWNFNIKTWQEVGTCGVSLRLGGPSPSFVPRSVSAGNGAVKASKQCHTDKHFMLIAYGRFLSYHKYVLVLAKSNHFLNNFTQMMIYMQIYFDRSRHGKRPKLVCPVQPCTEKITQTSPLRIVCT